MLMPKSMMNKIGTVNEAVAFASFEWRDTLYDYA
jgi:hypothetical protein